VSENEKADQCKKAVTVFVISKNKTPGALRFYIFFYYAQKVLTFL
jgi:hypothetical protein